MLAHRRWRKCQRERKVARAGRASALHPNDGNISLPKQHPGGKQIGTRAAALGTALVRAGCSRSPRAHPDTLDPAQRTTVALSFSASKLPSAPSTCTTESQPEGQTLTVSRPVNGAV